MCPIQVIPEAPIFVSKKSFDSDQAGGTRTQEQFDVRGTFYILPEGKSLEYEVIVFGFPLSPGGILESERLTPGHTKDELTLTTQEDSELSQELGVSMIDIDHVIYKAINP
jgi:hypothetical protein